MTRAEEYRIFLQSEFWINLSAKCKSRDNQRCVRCLSRRRLEAHHKFYQDDFYDTKLEDLETLCRRCHKVHHGIWKARAEKVSKKAKKKRWLAAKRQKPLTSKEAKHRKDYEAAWLRKIGG